MFLKDPSGNNLEFKAMTNPDNLFFKYEVFATKKWLKEEDPSFMAKAAAIKCSTILATCFTLNLAASIISYALQSWNSSSNNESTQF